MYSGNSRQSWGREDDGHPSHERVLSGFLIRLSCGRDHPEIGCELDSMDSWEF